MDDEKSEIVEIRRAVLNLYNAVSEADGSIEHLIAEVKQLNERLEKIEKSIDNQNGNSKRQ